MRTSIDKQRRARGICKHSLKSASTENLSMGKSVSNSFHISHASSGSVITLPKLQGGSRSPAEMKVCAPPDAGRKNDPKEVEKIARLESNIPRRL